MSKQFQLTRGMLLDFVNGLNEETAKVQPKGFNNNIHWHIGHLLVTAESFMFGYPKNADNVPAEYAALFGFGTKPADWQGDVPSIETLAGALKEQAGRLAELPESCFVHPLPFKFPKEGIDTVGDLYDLMLHHEAEHLGQMKAMKRIVEA
ncbi:DinB family protein [Bacillus sp. AGMB 02131]|uniref:DinB family protein n=1 Tax=Peribacillus faecalis TaxID=2772559 RepID=A0A927HAX8_9BACI|nr:DinB family protein [Peribacillus faecalis]MBD3108007.1 DinB family protein [Peribacillus faecalis]